mmetsp:Transcript_32444/g.89746  ORF Transcript_32444/g.89746 Transcript_32444/m.89746 type:complete len:203 (-) Transcript_32444:990-1598(-)
MVPVRLSFEDCVGPDRRPQTFKDFFNLAFQNPPFLFQRHSPQEYTNCVVDGIEDWPKMTCAALLARIPSIASAWRFLERQLPRGIHRPLQFLSLLFERLVDSLLLLREIPTNRNTNDAEACALLQKGFQFFFHPLGAIRNWQPIDACGEIRNSNALSVEALEGFYVKVRGKHARPHGKDVRKERKAEPVDLEFIKSGFAPIY